MGQRRPLRLTRRGRALLLSLCLLFVGLGTGAAAPASQAASAPVPSGPALPAGESTEAPAEVAVVRPGDTLWSVVARHAPGRDPYGIIEDIQRLNDLPDHTIHPGQELLLP